MLHTLAFIVKDKTWEAVDWTSVIWIIFLQPKHTNTQTQTPHTDDADTKPHTHTHTHTHTRHRRHTHHIHHHTKPNHTTHFVCLSIFLLSFFIAALSFISFFDIFTPSFLFPCSFMQHLLPDVFPSICVFTHLFLYQLGLSSSSLFIFHSPFAPAAFSLIHSFSFISIHSLHSLVSCSPDKQLHWSTNQVE